MYLTSKLKTKYMKTLKITIVLIAICFLTSCSVNRSSIVGLQNKSLLAYQRSLITEIKKIDNNDDVKVPTCEIWNTDRTDFIVMIKEYKDKNEEVRKKSAKTNSFFVITGTAVGVGGGIYGLFSNGDTKGTAVTSLIAGSLTGLVGSLNLEKKAERANTCSDFLDGMMLDFGARWGVARCPRNEEEFKAYLSAKDAIIESLKSMKCYGLPATN